VFESLAHDVCPMRLTNVGTRETAHLVPPRGVVHKRLQRLGKPSLVAANGNT
jgi:hypothetical protein